MAHLPLKLRRTRANQERLERSIFPPAKRDGQGFCRSLACRRDGRLGQSFLDLVETAHLTFKGAADGEIAFGALKGFLDVRYGTRDDSACAAVLVGGK